MYLILFTTIYCVIMRIFNLDHTLTFGIYIIGSGIIKGIFSKELKDVFNVEKTSSIYENIGLKDSLMELVSLMLIFINFLFINYESYSILEFLNIILVFTLIYRFLFWGITQRFKKFSIESSRKQRQ